MKKIFITGGAGFIGSHIVDKLLEKSYKVIVYDNFSSGTMDNLKHINNINLKIVTGDILDYNTLKESMIGCDYVSHHAAQLEIFLAFDEPERDLTVNTLGTLNVLKAAKENGIKKFINISSACVYGQTLKKTKETDSLTPNWDYGVSKLAAEKYAKIYNDYKGLPVVSLRYGIVYGEREWYRRVLPIFLKNIILNKPPVIFGNGEQIRDFIYVSDVVDFHNLCLENISANGLSFNVGTGYGITIKSLAENIVKLSDSNLTTIFEDTKEGHFSKLVEGKKRNTAELGRMILDISLAKKILNWEPKIKLIDGLKNELNWAKINIHRWDKIFTTKW
jgi:nucleoside-diphosphate-sugar epimerase